MKAFHARQRWVGGLVGALGLLGGALLGAVPAGAVSAPGPNGLIAFESGRDGDAEIFVMNPDGSAQTQLTFNKKIQDVDPSWSADGTRLAYTSDATGNPEIYVMNADGTGVTQLTFAAGEDRGSSWTSDNQKIVFHSARACNGFTPPPGSHCLDVFIMNADGTNQVNLTPDTLDSQDSAADVCGDSLTGRIVFNSNRVTPDNPTGDFEIFVMNIDGSGVQQLTFNDVLDSGPVWSPDCSQIAYNEDVGGQLDVFVMDADGSDPHNLTNNPAFDAFAAWSPDGQLIAFSSNRTPDANFDIFSMDAATGGNVTNLTNTPGVGELRAYWGTAPLIPVVGPPTAKDQCKNGGWQAFNNPSFKNEGDCLAFLQSNKSKAT